MRSMRQDWGACFGSGHHRAGMRQVSEARAFARVGPLSPSSRRECSFANPASSCCHGKRNASEKPTSRPASQDLGPTGRRRGSCTTKTAAMRVSVDRRVRRLPDSSRSRCMRCMPAPSATCSCVMPSARRVVRSILPSRSRCACSLARMGRRLRHQRKQLLDFTGQQQPADSNSRPAATAPPVMLSSRERLSRRRAGALDEPVLRSGSRRRVVR